MVKINTCVFISGKGTNLKKLLLNSNNYNFPIKIKLIISSNKNAEGLKLAKKWSIPYLIFDKNNPKRMIGKSLKLVIITIIPFFFLYLLTPEAIDSIVNYIQVQVINSINHVKTVDSRFYIVNQLWFQLRNPVWISIIFLFLAYILSKIKNLNLRFKSLLTPIL